MGKRDIMNNIGVFLAVIVVVVIVCCGLTLFGVIIGFVLTKVIAGINKGEGLIAGILLAIGTLHFVVKVFSTRSDHIWEIHEDEQIVDEPMTTTHARFLSRKKKKK
jgi:uncharacterized membrane protein